MGPADSSWPHHALAHQLARGNFTLPRPADHRSLSFRIGREIRLVFRRLRSWRAVRRLGAGLLSLGDPRARLVQAMEYVDRSFVRGGRGELASEGTPVGGDDKGDRSAVVGVTTQCLREVRNVCGSEVEVCAGDFHYFGEAANAGFGKLLRRTARLVGSKRATSNNRHQPVER
jgi:hypothetical protein